MLFFSKLRQISGRLGKIPSLAYALLYLLLMPGFASVYFFFMKNDFYHSTAQYERTSFDYAGAAIGQNITRSILSEVEQENHAVSCPGWSVDTAHLRVSKFRADDESMQFDIYIHLVSASGPRIEMYSDLKLRAKTLPSLSIWSTDGKIRSDYFLVQSDEHYQSRFHGDLSTDALVTCLFPPHKDGYLVPSLRLDGTQTALLQNYIHAKEGFPAGLNGQFVRMLYLSASTITTLGFGDIVPLTSSARLAVSCEAIVGIIVMGLFLNAVSKER